MPSQYKKPPSVSRNKTKLSVVFAVCATCFLGCPIIIGMTVFNFNLFLCIIPIIIPLAFGIIALSKGSKVSGWSKNVAWLKYHKYVPLFFYFDKVPDRYRFRGADNVIPLLESGDIILRRHDSYVDSLILGQSGYFTHAAIYVQEGNTNGSIWDATGSEGVKPNSVHEFLRCDDIAVLRFDFSEFESLSESMMETKAQFEPSFFKEPRVLGGVFTNRFERIGSKRVQDILQKNVESADLDQAKIALKELSIYNALNNKNYDSLPNSGYCKRLISELAKIGLGKGYDYDISFVDYTKFSCVEYVWYCYKCFIPLHAVGTKTFRYFSFIDTMIIVPDLFLRSKHFKLVYSSVPDKCDLKSLYQFAQSKRLFFWGFFLKFIGFQLLVLLLMALIISL